MNRPRKHEPLPVLRRRARRRALQAVYAWQISGQHMNDILAQFAEERDREGADNDYFEALTRGVERRRSEIDGHLAEVLDRPIAQIDAIELAALRLGSWELLERIDVPYRVVIDEAVGLVRHFGSEQGHNYVNGVLDALAARLRQAEYRR